MKNTLFASVCVLISCFASAQIIQKPVGCFAGTNGTNPDVLTHPEARGVLLSYKWTEIEPSPGVFDFTNLNNAINTVTNADLPYSLAILGGSFGSPNWLIDDLGASHFDFNYQNQDWRLPLWWNQVVMDRLDTLITAVGNQYANDPDLSHVYVTQMTVNGVEGHLNGVDMNAFASSGFTPQNWITSAEATTLKYADAFPTKPIVFEVHEIDQDTVVPSTIVYDMYNHPALCERFGLAMWWISGKTSYQTDMLDCIANFNGDKYAQVIGRSDQPQRFQDGLYSTVFTQAKELGIRYMEPWPYEFQHHTSDSLITDFNAWADAHFSTADTCGLMSNIEETDQLQQGIGVYPNPTNGKLTFENSEIQELLIFNMSGQAVLRHTPKRTGKRTSLNVTSLKPGPYVIRIITVLGKAYNLRFIKE